MAMLLAEIESPPMLKLDTAKVKAVREAIPLSQADAARVAKMTASRWNDIESGRRSNVTIETLGVVAKTLKCQPVDLLVETSRRK